MAKLSPKELADRLETDPKTVRRFLRQVIPPSQHPAKGRTWRIDPDTNWEKAWEAWFKKKANRSERIRRETHSTKKVHVIVSTGGMRTN